MTKKEQDSIATKAFLNLKESQRLAVCYKSKCENLAKDLHMVAKALGGGVNFTVSKKGLGVFDYDLGKFHYVKTLPTTDEVVEAMTRRTNLEQDVLRLDERVEELS